MTNITLLRNRLRRAEADLREAVGRGYKQYEQVGGRPDGAVRSKARLARGLAQNLTSWADTLTGIADHIEKFQPSDEEFRHYDGLLRKVGKLVDALAVPMKAILTVGYRPRETDF